MKRVGVALGLLGLICAAALPASAQVTLFGRNYTIAAPPVPKVLWQPDLTKGNPLIGVGTVYGEAVDSSGDQTGLMTPVSGGNGQAAPCLVITDSTDTRVDWLGGGDRPHVRRGCMGTGRG